MLGINIPSIIKIPVFMQNIQNITIFMQINLVLCKKIKIQKYYSYV